MSTNWVPLCPILCPNPNAEDFIITSSVGIVRADPAGGGSVILSVTGQAMAHSPLTPKQIREQLFGLYEYEEGPV